MVGGGGAGGGGCLNNQFDGKSVMSIYSVMSLWCHYYMCTFVYKVD